MASLSPIHSLTHSPWNALVAILGSFDLGCLRPYCSGPERGGGNGGAAFGS